MSELKLILEQYNIFSDNTLICHDDLSCIDKMLLEHSDKISEECFGIYKKFVSMKQNAPENMKKGLFNIIHLYSKEKNIEKAHYDALLMYRFLIVKSKLSALNYYEIAELLFSCGEVKVSEKFLMYYQKMETNVPLKLLTVANFYNLSLKDYKTAIKYYEQYINIEQSKSVIFSILGNLYRKVYGDESLNEQNYYFEQAYKLKPDDRLVLHFLAFNHEKSGNKDLADKYYKELLANNPTETDYYNYGGFLISCGKISEGHKYLAHRFNIGDINLEYPKSLDKTKKWDFKTDIKDKVLLIHYEQGFGDTFMYCRFVPLMKQFAKRIIFIVQDELYDLILHSDIISNGIEVFPCSINISDINYDYGIALLDLPCVLNISAQNIPFSGEYLTVSQNLVSEYGTKFIKHNNKIKVGISYQGNIASNYKGRDIEFSKLENLLQIPNIDFYSFNLNKHEENNKIINLGDTLNNFTDTACALKCMDLVVSTDNVILNLAGALGIKTYGIFNKYPNFRWFKLSGENTGWYKSVKPFQVRENNLWLPVVSQIMNEIKIKK